MRGNPSDETIELQKQRLVELYREGLISVEAAARIAQCPQGTVHTWVRTGKLATSKKSFGRLFVSEAEVQVLAGVTKVDDGPHTRIGPGIDKAPCGVAGSQVEFSQTFAGIKCTRCRKFRSNPKRAAEQLAKMRRVGQARRDDIAVNRQARRRNG